jgi:hypothetical protein
LQHFLPAIAALSPEPNKQLDVSSVQSEGRYMDDTDWNDFVDRLTKYDPAYSPGKLADPGDLIDYILSLASEVASQFEVHFRETMTFRCTCPGGCNTENIVAELGLTIHNSSNEPLAQQIINTFRPEPVSDYRCDWCRKQANTNCPAIRTRHPHSFPQTLRVNITASLAENALPRDFHQFPLERFEDLELSPSDHFILKAAVLYSRRHYWVYVNGRFPIIIDDERSRIATLDDRQTVAKCARILFYVRRPGPSPMDLAISSSIPRTTQRMNRTGTSTANVPFRNESKYMSDLTKSLPASAPHAKRQHSKLSSQDTPDPTVRLHTGRQMTLADFFPPQLKAAVLENSLTKPQRPNLATERHSPRPPLFAQQPDALDSPTVHGPLQNLIGQSNLFRLVSLRQDIPDATPWKPGTRNLYPRPAGAQSTAALPYLASTSSEHEPTSSNVSSCRQHYKERFLYCCG